MCPNTVSGCPFKCKKISFISSWTSILSTTSLYTWHCDEV